MWAGEFCGGCAGYKHPAVCQDRSHCSMRDRPASCKLWHLKWSSNHWQGTIGSSSGNPRAKQHVLSDAEVALTLKNEKLKKYVAEMEMKNHRRNEDTRTQRACVAAVTLSQQQQQPQQPQPRPQSAWGPPPGPTSLATSSPPDWAAALILSVQQLQMRVDSRFGLGH
jgi:hypothetical protein